MRNTVFLEVTLGSLVVTLINVFLLSPLYSHTSVCFIPSIPHTSSPHPLNAGNGGGGEVIQVVRAVIVHTGSSGI
jgi:hypothetical protein